MAIGTKRIVTKDFSRGGAYCDSLVDFVVARAMSHSLVVIFAYKP